jgi:DNA-binding transcriptional ArsR family regulator
LRERFLGVVQTTDVGLVFNWLVKYSRRMATTTAAPPVDLDAAFAALADPTRRAIVSRLAEGECTVNDLAAPFDVSLPAISRHLKVLEHAGLISRHRDAQRRPCRLRADALDAMGRYVLHTRAVWEQRLDRLEQFLATDTTDTTHTTDAADAQPTDGSAAT